MKHMITGLLAGLLLGVPATALAVDAAPNEPKVSTTVHCPDVPGDRWASCPYRVTVRGTDHQPFEVKVGHWLCSSRFDHTKGYRVTTCERRHR